MEALTFDALKTAALVLVALFGFNKIIVEIVGWIGKYTRKSDKIETFDPEKIKEDIHKCMDYRYNEMQRRYDEELRDIKNDISDNHTDTAAQIQEIKAELYLQTECNAAIIDGLVQLNCNGPVKEAKERLEQYLNKRAHDI